MLIHCCKVSPTTGRIISGTYTLDSDDVKMVPLEIQSDGTLYEVTHLRHKGHDVGVYPIERVWVDAEDDEGPWAN